MHVWNINLFSMILLPKLKLKKNKATQSGLKTLNVVKWLPEEAEAKPEKQLREDLMKKKSQLSTLESPHPFKARQGSFIYVAHFMHSANLVRFTEWNPAAQDRNIQQNH